MKQKFKTNMDKVDQSHNGRKCVMLAHGESGHAHAFYDTDIVDYDQDTGKLQITGQASLDHEEHTSQVIAPGIGEVTIQREYERGFIRQVQD